MFSPESIAKARYAGRALAIMEKGNMVRVNGSDTFRYYPPDTTGHYVVDVTNPLSHCDCAEYHSNLHQLQAAAAGKKVWRNPGCICKHCLAAMGKAGHLDVLAVCQDLPEPLKEEARRAYKRELARFH